MPRIITDLVLDKYSQMTSELEAVLTTVDNYFYIGYCYHRRQRETNKLPRRTTVYNRTHRTSFGMQA